MRIPMWRLCTCLLQISLDSINVRHGQKLYNCFWLIEEATRWLQGINRYAKQVRHCIITQIFFNSIVTIYIYWPFLPNHMHRVYTKYKRKCQKYRPCASKFRVNTEYPCMRQTQGTNTCGYYVMSHIRALVSNTPVYGDELVCDHTLKIIFPSKHNCTN